MRGDTHEGLKDELPEDALSVEKQQEKLLLQKLAANGRPAKPVTSFLQKRLQHRKFFDSGDYAMDKNKAKAEGKQPHPPVVPEESHAEVQCDSESNEVHHKTPAPSSPVSPSSEEVLQIPTPENVPQRKASIIFPSVHSKLSPQPHIHHHDIPESL